MTTMCTVYAVSASDPTAASGASDPRPPVGDRRGTPAITRSATPTLPTTSKVVDECGSAVASAAGQPSRCSATQEPPCPRITSPTPTSAPSAAQPGGAQVAAADREPDQQVRRPHDRRVVVADRDLGEDGRPRVLEGGGDALAQRRTERRRRRPRPSAGRPATSAAPRSPSANSSPYVGRITTTGVARITRSSPRANSSSARTRMRTRACTSRVPVTGFVLPESSASDRPARTTNSAAGRPSASCAKPPGGIGSVVVGTDVRGHHPEHGEAPGDVDPHDAAHDRMLASPANRVISHVETVRPGY